MKLYEVISSCCTLLRIRLGYVCNIEIELMSIILLALDIGLIWTDQESKYKLELAKIAVKETVVLMFSMHIMTFSAALL